MNSIFPMKGPCSLWIAMIMELNLDRIVFFIHALEAQVTIASSLDQAMLMMFIFNGYVFSAYWSWDIFSGFLW